MNAKPAAVLFDRDGTLVEDTPYNGDPRRVTPMPGAREAVAHLRARHIRVGVVTNQSGVARGLLTTEQVLSVHARIDELLGPFDDFQFCPHEPEDRCDCRKPAPGMVLAACAALGVQPSDTVVIGDIGADVDAARAAGAWAVLVPTQQTRPQEVADAPVLASDLLSAVRLAEALLGRESA